MARLEINYKKYKNQYSKLNEDDFLELRRKYKADKSVIFFKKKKYFSEFAREFKFELFIIFPLGFLCFFLSTLSYFQSGILGVIIVLIDLAFVLAFVGYFLSMFNFIESIVFYNRYHQKLDKILKAAENWEDFKKMWIEKNK